MANIPVDIEQKLESQTDIYEIPTICKVLRKFCGVGKANDSTASKHKSLIIRLKKTTHCMEIKLRIVQRKFYGRERKKLGLER